MDTAVRLHISGTTDTEEEKRIAAAIQKLVNNELDAAQAAQEIDTTIVVETELAKEPDAAGWQKYLWDCLGKSAMDVPANHAAQGRLVELISQLQQLPRHQARQRANGSMDSMELCVLTPANQYAGFVQWLWTLNEGQFTGHQQVEKSESAAAKYLNFSAFLARLLAAGRVEATQLSALVRPSPFATRTPSGDSPPQGGVYASAAAVWIIYAGSVLFEMCEKDTKIDLGTPKWTRERWDSWKAKFMAVAATDAFSAQTRSLASEATKRMQKRENAGVTTDVVSKLGFMTSKEDEDGDHTYSKD